LEENFSAAVLFELDPELNALFLRRVLDRRALRVFLRGDADPELDRPSRSDSRLIDVNAGAGAKRTLISTPSNLSFFFRLYGFSPLPKSTRGEDLGGTVVRSGPALHPPGRAFYDVLRTEFIDEPVQPEIGPFFLLQAARRTTGRAKGNPVSSLPPMEPL